jgi:hypothetical protein
MIKRINPRPPLGQYPHPELYGHAGSAPINSRIRIINKMVPMASPFLTYFVAASHFGPSTSEACTLLFRSLALLTSLDFLCFHQDCVFARFDFAPSSRGIDLCEFSTEKKDLR